MNVLLIVKRQDGMSASRQFGDMRQATEEYLRLCADTASKRVWLTVGKQIVRSWDVARGELV